MAKSTSTNDIDDVALNFKSTNVKRSNEWYFDSGATKHMTFQQDLLIDYIEFKKVLKIYPAIQAGLSPTRMKIATFSNLCRSLVSMCQVISDG